LHLDQGQQHSNTECLEYIQSRQGSYKSYEKAGAQAEQNDEQGEEN